ncbi:MAG: SDR family NAD(P)-dependent oxidoreductase [Acidobacteriaceae bacterium]|nr:SDR family NAD(P)-dependent oxidoreductase [Acidobacteriaceae bacterium]
MKLTGKIVLVTGGTDGIGAQLIRQLRSKGAHVLTSGRNPLRIAATRADGFEVIEADISSQAGIDSLITQLNGRVVDILINNAGLMDEYDLERGSPEPQQIEQVLFVNMHAPIQLITALLPVFQERQEAAIVNVTSGNAVAPRAKSPVYSATKAGIRSFTQALRFQLAGSNIQVIEALPPGVETAMNKNSKRKTMSAKECARQIVVGIERNQDEINVGQVKLLQFANSISPALARWIMLRY